MSNEFDPFATTAPVVDEQQAPPEHDERLEFVAFAAMLPNPYQPRQVFTDAELEDLKVSILEHGVMQKPLLRPDPEIEDGFQIIAGERRIRACQRIPGVNGMWCVIREASDKEVAQMGYAENVKRVDLNVIEIACHYRTMIKEFGQSQKELAVELEVSEPVISNRLRLLELPKAVITLIREKRLSEAHGKLLCSLVPDEAPIIDLAVKAVTEELATRPLEALVKERKAAIDARIKAEQDAANPKLFPDDEEKPVITQLSIERWRILEYLERYTHQSSEDISTHLGLEYTLVEQSLEYMKELGLVKAEFLHNVNFWSAVESNASDRIKGVGHLPAAKPTEELHPIESGIDGPSDSFRDGDRFLTGPPAKIYRLLKDSGSLNAKQIKAQLGLDELDLAAALQDMKYIGMIVGNVIVLDSGQSVELYEIAPPAPEDNLSLMQRRVLRYITHNPRVESGEISGALDESVSEVTFAVRDLVALGLIAGEETDKGTCYRATATKIETALPPDDDDEELPEKPAVVSQHVEVRPDRLKDGGDIYDSYSADVIAQKGTVRKPFEYKEKKYVCVSRSGSSDNIAARCYQLVDESEFVGPSYTYSEHTGAGYHGIKIYGKWQHFVLSGPEITFVPYIGVAPAILDAPEEAAPTLPANELKVLECVAEGLGVTLRGLSVSTGIDPTECSNLLSALTIKRLITEAEDGAGWVATQSAISTYNLKVAGKETVPPASAPATITPVEEFVQVEGPPVSVIVNRSEAHYADKIGVRPDDVYTAYRRLYAVACFKNLTVDEALTTLENRKAAGQ